MSTSQKSQSPLCQYSVLFTLQEDMKRMKLDAERTGDISLVPIGGVRKYKVHSSVAAARCKNLTEQIRTFRYNSQAKNRGAESLVISVEACSNEAMHLVLGYIYDGIFAFPQNGFADRPRVIVDVILMSISLGIPSLKSTLFELINDHLPRTDMLVILDYALHDERTKSGGPIVEKLTCMFLEDEGLYKVEDKFIVCRSQEFWMHILKQDKLEITEEQLWSCLIKSSCHQCDIFPYRLVSNLCPVQRALVAKRMAMFCVPDLLRVIMFGTKFFLTEVEPLGTFPPSEVLLKYQFDVTVDTEPFNKAFMGDRFSFLRRTRRNVITFESQTHPHARGRSWTDEISFPSWVPYITLDVDSRTELSRYADLKIYTVGDARKVIFSLKPELTSAMGQSPTSSNDTPVPAKGHHIAPVSFKGHAFICEFYCPEHVGTAAWGYKFTATSAY